MKTHKSILRNIGDYMFRIAKAIVSGLPRERVVFKPNSKTVMHHAKDNFKPDSEKHYHRPMAKPAVEKQTLLKENKKVKTVH